MNEKVHFDEFVEQVALESGFDTDTAKEYVQDLFETIVEENSKGRWVKLRNFGSFKPTWYKAKRGINPQTKEPLDILPHYHINFKSSKDLETILNTNETLKPISFDTPANRFMDKLFLILLFIVSVWIVKALIFSTDEKVVPLEIQEPVKSVVIHEETLVEEEPEEKIVEPVQEVLADVVVHEEDVIEDEIIHPGVHTIRKDQTLTFIGRKVYEDGYTWPLIFTANDKLIINPDKILNGYTITIPTKAEGQPLHKAYIDVYNAYMNMDKMRKSFWILCQGAKDMGSGFQEYLKGQLHPMEYKIIQRCVNRKLLK